MAATVRLSDKLVEDARKEADVSMRSLPKQIEYWCKLGKTVEERPDLSLNEIRKIEESASSAPSAVASRGTTLAANVSHNATKGRGLLRKASRAK
jgi:hypothetical protein